MPDHQIHALVLSSNRGRYACDSADGRDLTSGTLVSILLGNQWIAGRIEHSRHAIYAVESAREVAVGGYYFIADTDTTVCGLTVGMQVKLL